jgi:hypothetical protein
MPPYSLSGLGGHTIVASTEHLLINLSVPLPLDVAAVTYNYAVLLYNDANFPCAGDGPTWMKWVKDADVGRTLTWSNFNDVLTSARVHNGYQLMVFENSPPSGTQLLLEGDIANLGLSPYNFNDRMSSAELWSGRQA